MQLHWIKPLIGIPGPFATIYLDATRGDESGYREVMNRWQGLRRSLENQGAPSEVVELLEERVAEPTHAAGAVGRFLIAGVGEILVDRVLLTPPAKDEAVFGGAPALRAAAAASDAHVNYFLIEVDRQRASVKTPPPHNPHAAPELYAEITGEHDVVHKVRGGGFHHSKLQSRAEDSWHKNAGHIAKELDELVELDRPELLIFTGDVRAVSLVEEKLGEPARTLGVQLPGGGRADGAEDAHFMDRLGDVLTEFRDQRRREIVERFEQEYGRDGAAVAGRADVLGALVRGQVAELLIAGDGATSPEPDAMLWIGSDALQVAETESEIREQSETAEKLAADIALLRAAVGQDAGVTFVHDQVQLPDGVGAVLRWRDAATAGDNVFSLSDDAQRLRA